MSHPDFVARGARQLDTIGRFMTCEVVSVPPNALIEQALDVMLENKISGLPVVDGDGRLVGVISEFDALKLLLESVDEAGLIAPVAHYMSTKVISIPDDTPVATAAQIFHNTGVRRLPVVRAGRLVGIVSRRDLLHLVRQWRRELDFETLGDAHWQEWVQS